MSRYFFHTEGNHLHIDQDGTELPTFEAVRTDAMQMAGEMLREGTVSDQLPDGVPWRLWVTDGPGAAGATVVSIHILIENGAPQPLALPQRTMAHVVVGQ